MNIQYYKFYKKIFMKIRKASVMCLASFALLFGAFVIPNNRNTVHATPGKQISASVWHVWGADSLEREKSFLSKRTLPQGRDKVIDIINTCIREGRTLQVVWYPVGIPVGNYHIYSIV